MSSFAISYYVIENICCYPARVQKMHYEKFDDWFKTQLELGGSTIIPEHLHQLANYPWPKAKCFHTFHMHGYKFQTRGKEKNRKTQHGGVVTRAQIIVDGVDKTIDFYGVITDVSPHPTLNSRNARCSTRRAPTRGTAEDIEWVI